MFVLRLSRISYMKKHKCSIKSSIECSICGKLFNKNWYLQRHIKQMHTSNKNQNTEKQTQKSPKEKKLDVCKTLNLKQLDKVNENDLEALTELSLLQSYFVDDNDTLLPDMISNNLIDLSEYDGNVVTSSTPRYMKQVYYISLHSFLSPSLCKEEERGGGDQDFKQDMLIGGNFF